MRRFVITKGKGDKEMTYRELREKHQQEVNAFPFMFAFSDEQFKNGMEKLGLKEDETDKIYSIGGGGYILKTSAPAMHDMFDRHRREMEEAMNDDTFAYGAFLYELGNHEFCITYDWEPTLEALGMTVEDVLKDERLNGIFKKARHDYLEEYE